MNGKKISAHLVASALVIILVWCARTFAKVEIPAEVGIAIGTVLAVFISIIVPDSMEADDKQAGFAHLGIFPLLIIAALGVFVMLTQGCAGNVVNPGASIKVPESLPEAGQEAQKIINGANVLLTSAYRTIGNNAAAGVWTKAQAQGFQDRANQYSDDIDRAQGYIKLGLFNDAKAQAELVNDLLLILSKEVADQARKAQP